MKKLPINSKNTSLAAVFPYRLTPTFMLRASLNILFLLIFISFFLLPPAYSAGSDSSDDKPAKPAHSKEYYKAVKLIKAGSFDEALAILETIIQKKPDDADIHNYMGYSFRKKGMLEKSSYHYEQALDINPKHLGALEYQGELYIALGEIDKAKANLTKIDDICWTQCSELRELEQAIEKAVN